MALFANARTAGILWGTRCPIVVPSRGSSILTRYTKDIFTELTVSTIQEFYKEKEIEIIGSPMKFQIWDTAGQEKFRSIVRNYYLGAIAAILVYDVTDRDSFDRVVNYWYKEIKESNPNISMYIFLIL